MNEDDLRERFRVILEEELPHMLPAETVTGIAARLARAAQVGEIVEIAYQHGKCTRCGKPVTRSGPDNRWTDFYGRDRCRASEDDSQCDVTRVRDGVRYAQLRDTGRTTVTLEGPGGEVAYEQTVPSSGSWAEGFSGLLVRAGGINVRHDKVQYKAEVTPEDLMALGIAIPHQDREERP